VVVPDESAFITYLNHKNLENEIILNTNSPYNLSTFVLWINNTPKIYDSISNEEIYYLVKNAACFFGRKFSPKCDLSYLKKLIVNYS
jgi:hypothetical protein